GAWARSRPRPPARGFREGIEVGEQDRDLDRRPMVDAVAEQADRRSGGTPLCEQSAEVGVSGQHDSLLRLRAIEQDVVRRSGKPDLADVNGVVAGVTQPPGDEV